MAGHLLSTTARIEAEEAAARTGADGWVPAGPPLTEHLELMKEAEVELREATKITEFPLGTPAPRAIPSIGNIVVYHLRTGDSRNRRVKFPAIVMDGDPATGALKLWVIVDDGDTWMQDNVPARVEPEPGWELVDRGSSEFAVSQPQVALFATVVEALTSRIGTLEDTVNALMTARKVGRPPKPKE